MKKIVSLFLIIAGTSILFSSCEKKFIDLSSPPSGTLHFSTDIVPLLSNKCTGCHNSTGQSPSFEASVAYDNVMTLVNKTAPESSLIYTHITENPNHHGGGVFQAEGDKILDWIIQGAKND